MIFYAIRDKETGEWLCDDGSWHWNLCEDRVGVVGTPPDSVALYTCKFDAALAVQEEITDPTTGQLTPDDFEIHTIKPSAWVVIND